MKVKIHKVAEKYLNRLGANDRDRIDEAIECLEKEPPEGDIVPYVGSPGIFRLKIKGCKYRVIFTFKSDHILITHIEPRGQAYTKKTKTKRGKK